MQRGSIQGGTAAETSTTLLPPPQFLVEPQPWARTFIGNVFDLVRPPEHTKLDLSLLDLNPAIGRFWDDVFVATPLPWRRFAESALYHAIAIAILWSFPRLLPPAIQPVPIRTFDAASVIYYSKDDYLPPLNTVAHQSPATAPQPADPEYSPQPIISVPPDSDNTRQTIVTPPDVKLQHDLDIPNIVAWTPRDIPVPIAATSRTTSELQLPALPISVVTPAPEISRASELKIPTLAGAVIAPAPQVETAALRSMEGPKSAIIEPPPSVPESTRKLGDMNIGPQQVIVPAPQLKIAEQRVVPATIKSALPNATNSVVPPPPLLTATENSPVAERFIALGLRPAVIRAPIEVPVGNRRGTFAATPDGKPGALGIPAAPPAAAERNAASPTQPAPANAPAGLPARLYVGPSQNPKAPLAGSARINENAQQHAVDPRLLANVTFPKLASPRRSSTAVDELHATELDKQVFGPRRFYSMTLNMPNLNSIGGSWVIRFAELKEDGAPGELVPPIATRKVDPAYPAELMRTRVEATITLYAVIHSDGTVGDVRVLAGDDERLTRFASSALARWHFRPATKNGNAVALEAVVTIPFRAGERP